MYIRRRYLNTTVGDRNSILRGYNGVVDHGHFIMFDDLMDEPGSQSDWSFPSDWETEPNDGDPHTRQALPIPQFNGVDTEYFVFDNVLQAKKLCSVMDLRKEDWMIVMPLHMISLLRTYVKMRDSNKLFICRADKLHFD